MDGDQLARSSSPTIYMSSMQPPCYCKVLGGSDPNKRERHCTVLLSVSVLVQYFKQAALAESIIQYDTLMYDIIDMQFPSDMCGMHTVQYCTHHCHTESKL